MKRNKILAYVLALSMTMTICSCGKKSDETAVENGAETNITTEETMAEVMTETTTTEATTTELISDEQAIIAIRNYCCIMNPDLESIVAEDYPVYWEIASSDESVVVILFRSYTGALVRYYIDRATGNTNVTEFVPGIMEQEEPTDESFNVTDYMS